MQFKCDVSHITMMTGYMSQCPITTTHPTESLFISVSPTTLRLNIGSLRLDTGPLSEWGTLNYATH